MPPLTFLPSLASPSLPFPCLSLHPLISRYISLQGLLRRERGHLHELTSRNASRAGSSRSSGVANPTARPLTAHPPLAAPAAPGLLPTGSGGAPVPSRRVVYDGSPPPSDEVLELRQRLHRDPDADGEGEGWCESSTTPLHLPRTAPRTSQSARGPASSSSTDLPTLYGPPTTARPGASGGRNSPRLHGHASFGGVTLPAGPPSSPRFATPRPPGSAR